MNRNFGGAAPVLAILVVAASGTVAIGGGAAASGETTTATPIDSCTTIREPGHYRLTTDLTNVSAEECILVRSDDVVFDGGGHTIDGEGPTVGGHRIPIRIGYTDRYHVENVTVKDVVVTEWHQGVGISRASNSVVRNVTARRNGKYGIYIGDDARNNAILDSVVTDTLDNGIFLADRSDDNRIVNNTVRRNGHGISIYDSERNVVADNTATNNSMAGVFVGNGADDNRIVNNTVRRNRGGIAVIGSDGNLVADNTVTNNAQKGIVVGHGATDNVLVDNVARSNGRLGIQVLEANGTELRNNTASSNENHGFLLVDASGNVLQDNTATANGDWDYQSRDGSANNTVARLRLGPETVVSFDGDAVALRAVAAPAPPAGHGTIGDGVQVGGLDSALPITFHYGMVDGDSVDESSVRVWRHDGSWTPIEDGHNDPGADHVSVNVSDGGSVFGLLYERPDTPTPTPTPVPATNEPTGTVTATTEDTTTSASDPAATAETDTSSPGIGALGALAALVIALGVAVSLRGADRN